MDIILGIIAFAAIFIGICTLVLVAVMRAKPEPKQEGGE